MSVAVAHGRTATGARAGTLFRLRNPVASHNSRT